MNRTFIEVPIFTKKWKESGLTDENLRELENILLENPKSGDTIQGTGGLRKIRIPLSSKGKCGGARACLKNHSCHLHAPICAIFAPNSGYIARYAPFIWHKSPTNCDAHLAESIFQTRSRVIYIDIELRETIYFINVYTKNEKDDLTEEGKKVFKAVVSSLKEG